MFLREWLEDRIEHWRRPRRHRNAPPAYRKPSIAEMMACAAQNTRHLLTEGKAPQWRGLSKTQQKAEIDATKAALRTLPYINLQDIFPTLDPAEAASWRWLTALVAQDTAHE